MLFLNLRKEVMAVIPKTAHNISDMRTERWVHMVHSKIRELDNMSPQRSKILFLGKSHNSPSFVELIKNRKWLFFVITVKIKYAAS